MDGQGSGAELGMGGVEGDCAGAGPKPHRADSAVAGEVEWVIPDEHSGAGQGEGHSAAGPGPRGAVAVENPDHHPGRVHDVSAELCIVGGDREVVTARVRGQAPVSDVAALEVTVDAQLGPSQTPP